MQLLHFKQKHSELRTILSQRDEKHTIPKLQPSSGSSCKKNFVILGVEYKNSQILSRINWLS